MATLRWVFQRIQSPYGDQSSKARSAYDNTFSPWPPLAPVQSIFLFQRQGTKTKTMNALKISTVLALLIFTEMGRAHPLDNWTLRYPAQPPPFSRFAYGNGQFVAVGRYGTIMTSTDGVSWVGRQSGTNKRLRGI